MSSEKATVSPAVRASSHSHNMGVAVSSLSRTCTTCAPEHTIMVRGSGAFSPLSKDLCRPEHTEATQACLRSRVDDCCPSRTRGRVTRP